MIEAWSMIASIFISLRDLQDSEEEDFIPHQSSFRDIFDYLAIISQIEPNCIKVSKKDPNLMMAK